MYYAINKGIELSQGEIISYLNVDDRYPIGALKKVLSSFNDHRADYVYGDCRFINTLEKEIYVYINIVWYVKYASIQFIWSI